MFGYIAWETAGLTVNRRSGGQSTTATTCSEIVNRFPEVSCQSKFKRHLSLVETNGLIVRFVDCGHGLPSQFPLADAKEKPPHRQGIFFDCFLSDRSAIRLTVRMTLLSVYDLLKR
jgi:hypothetical protein